MLIYLIMKFNKKMEVSKMTDLNFKKEYNNVSSTVNNMDVFDIYINDWGGSTIRL